MIEDIVIDVPSASKESIRHIEPSTDINLYPRRQKITYELSDIIKPPKDIRKDQSPIDPVEDSSR